MCYCARTHTDVVTVVSSPCQGVPADQCLDTLCMPCSCSSHCHCDKHSKDCEKSEVPKLCQGRLQIFVVITKLHRQKSHTVYHHIHACFHTVDLWKLREESPLSQLSCNTPHHWAGQRKPPYARQIWCIQPVHQWASTPAPAVSCLS